jgi:anti-anti-sigma factor
LEVLVLAVGDHLDGLRKALTELRVIRQHGARLVLDLAGVTFIDCAGINTLLATRRRAQLEGGSLRVLRASPRVRRLITLTRLDAVLMPTAAQHAVAS